MVGFLVIAGIGVSTYHPAAYASIHDAGHGTDRTYGAFEATGALAVIVMLAAQGLLAARAGWRGLIVVGAVPGALIGLLLVAMPRIATWDRRGKAYVAPLMGGTKRVAQQASPLLSRAFSSSA